MAAISLLVGGIGVMNIMLVTVTERTREIGIRKAIGARRSDILGQFLTEAVLLSILGGVTGVVAGLIGGRFKIVGVQPVIAPYSVALAFGVGVAVGLFFGIYPANRAAALHHASDRGGFVMVGASANDNVQPELAAGDDDFVAEILTRRKRRLPILTAILVLAVAAGGAFIAGAEVQKHYGKSTSAGTGSGASAFSALASRFRAGAGGGTGRGAFFGAGGAGGGTTGTVTLIKGSTLYVTNSSGTTVLVHTSPASRVTGGHRQCPDDPSRRHGDGDGRPGRERRIHGGCDLDQGVARVGRRGLVAMVLVIMPLSLLAAGCGGSSSASAPPTTTTTTTTAGTPGASVPQSAALTAFTSCLKQHGITTTGFGGFGRRPTGASSASVITQRPPAGSGKSPGSRGGSAQPERRVAAAGSSGAT